MRLNQTTIAQITAQLATTVLLTGAVSLASAATFIEGVKVEPAEIKAGQMAKITITGSEGESVFCGVKLHFGDGTTQDIKLIKKGTLPLVIDHVYAKAGEFKVLVEPKKVTSHIKCGGQNQNAMIKVVALPVAAVAPVVAPAVAPAAPAAPAAPVAATAAAAPVKPSPKPAIQCPEGWNLDTKSVNKASGAFSCTAKVGAKLPEGKLSCTKGLGYYENADKGLIGCRP